MAISLTTLREVLWTSFAAVVSTVSTEAASVVVSFVSPFDMELLPTHSGVRVSVEGNSLETSAVDANQVFRELFHGSNAKNLASVREAIALVSSQEFYDLCCQKQLEMELSGNLS